MCGAMNGMLDAIVDIVAGLGELEVGTGVSIEELGDMPAGAGVI